jgi:hypothetical protein
MKSWLKLQPVVLLQKHQKRKEKGSTLKPKLLRTRELTTTKNQTKARVDNLGFLIFAN